MTQPTRAYTVRVSGKQITELVKFFEQQENWQIFTIGGFLRDLVDLVHANIQDELTPEQQIESEAEAEEFLQRFGTGRVARNNLTQSMNSQVLGGGKAVKNPQKAEKQRQRRQRKKEAGYSEKSNEAQMPVHIHQKYRQLDGIQTGMIDLLMNQDESWSYIEEQINNMLNPQPSQEETEQVDSDVNKSYEQNEKERKEKDQQQLNEMKNQLSQKPPQHNEESD